MSDLPEAMTRKAAKRKVVAVQGPDVVERAGPPPPKVHKGVIVSELVTESGHSVEIEIFGEDRFREFKFSKERLARVQANYASKRLIGLKVDVTEDYSYITFPGFTGL